MNKDLIIEIKANTKKAIADVEALKKEVANFDKKIKTSTTSLKANNTTLDTMSSKIAGLAVAFGGFSMLKEMVTTISEFEKSITKLGAVSGASATELKQLEDK